MKNNVPAYIAPPKEIPATIADVINAGKALSVLLGEESALIDSMQVSKVGDLQERKLKLTGLMERYTHYLNKHPEVQASATAAEKTELQETARLFQAAMKKNHDTLLVARAVNRAVVKCVTQIVTKKELNPTYNAKGAMRHMAAYHIPVSVTLNQMI